MPWTQVYDPFGHWWLSTIVAALPIIVLLGLLAGFRVKPHWWFRSIAVGRYQFAHSSHFLSIFVWPDSLTAFILWRRCSSTSPMSAKHAHEVLEALEDPDPAILRGSRPGVHHRKRRQ